MLIAVPAPKIRSTAPSRVLSAASNISAGIPGESVKIARRRVSNLRCSGARAGACGCARKASAACVSCFTRPSAGSNLPAKASTTPTSAGSSAAQIACARLASASPPMPSGTMDPHSTTRRAVPASACESAAPLWAIVSVPCVKITGRSGWASIRSRKRFHSAGPTSALSSNGSNAMVTRSVPLGSAASMAASTSPAFGASPFAVCAIPIVPPLCKSRIRTCASPQKICPADNGRGPRDQAPFICGGTIIHVTR